MTCPRKTQPGKIVTRAIIDAYFIELARLKSNADPFPFVPRIDGTTAEQLTFILKDQSSTDRGITDVDVSSVVNAATPAELEVKDDGKLYCISAGHEGLVTQSGKITPDQLLVR